MTPQPDIQQIEQTLRLIPAPDSIGEIRFFDQRSEEKKGGIGYFFTVEEIPQAAEIAYRENETLGGYLVMNDSGEALIERPRLSRQYSLTKDVDIARRRWLPIDFDPHSPERGAADSSTDAEKENARQLMELVQEWLRELGFPEPVFADSGNGWHLLYRLDFPNDGESHQLVKMLLDGLAKRFNTDQVGVDISVHNASRVFKLYGTVARKGQDRPDRPHRLSKILSVPDGGAGIVSKELIVKAIRELTVPAGVTLLDREQSTGDERSTATGNLGDFTLTKSKLILPEQFPEGGRHANLIAVAGAARSFGSNEVEILEILRTFNRTRCANGKPDDELQKIARDFARKDCNQRMLELMESTSDEQKPSALKFLTAGELLNGFPSLKPYLIEGLMRLTETMNIISAPKFGKSWLVMGLVLCIACGLKWLGKFWCKRGRVLLVDNELHPETLASRLPRVAEAMGLKQEDYQDNVCVITLRGQLIDLERLSAQLLTLEPGSFDLIVLDAWYRLQPKGSDENANGDVSQLYNLLDMVAGKIGSGFVCVHHSSKGNQSGKSVTDVGSGAGAQARAPDVHMVLRAHEADNAVVVDAAIRSSAPLDPFVMRWQWPTWTVADDLDPKDLRQERPRKKTEAVDDGGMSPEAKQQERELTARQKVLEAYSTVPDGDTETRIRDAAGLNGRNFAPIHSALLRAKFIERCDVKRGNGATYAGHKITDAGLVELGQLGQQLGQLLSDLSHTTRTSAPPLGGTVCPSSSSGDLFGGRPA